MPDGHVVTPAHSPTTAEDRAVRSTPNVTLIGAVTGDAGPYAVDKIAAVADAIDEPVLSSRVVLSWSPDPAVERRARVEVAIDINGTVVRAGVRAHNHREAVDLVVGRLHKQLSQRADRERHRSTRRTAAPGEWRHGNLPTDHPDYFPRPAEEREIIRHQSFEPEAVTVEEAAWDMALAEGTFTLFTDLTQGLDAILWRDDDETLHYRAVLAAGRELDTAAVDKAAGILPLTIDQTPAPRLSLSEARERLDAGGEPFVFYAEHSSGRGAVLYHRYDGHYGLVQLAS